MVVITLTKFLQTLAVRMATKQYHLADYNILEQLGNGSFGTVFLVTELSDEQKTRKCIKRIPLRGGSSRKLTINEANLLSEIDCPNIIKYYASFQDGDSLYCYGIC